MKLVLFALLVASLAVSNALCSQPEDDHVSEDQPAISARARFTLPKLFDFEHFKAMFNRQYRSTMDELARRKLYLARAFSAFISMIKYKNEVESTYQSINYMSDWTLDEYRDTLINVELLRVDLPPADEQDKETVIKRMTNETLSTRDELDESVADIEEIEQELSSIVANHKGEKGYEKIIAELEVSQSEDSNANRRRKRSLTGDRRSSKRTQLTANDLIRAPSAEYVSHVPSNNPDYEPAEVTSFGATMVEEPKEAMPNEEAYKITSILGGGYVRKLVDGAVSLISSAVASYSGVIPMDEKVYYDLRDTGCLTQAGDQGSCGGCFIFAMLALYEYNYCRATGNLVSFSPQYVIDCGRGMQHNNGCQGGHPIAVGYFASLYGFELSSHYPYRAVQEECPYNKETQFPEMGYIRVEEKTLYSVTSYRWESYLRSKTALTVGILAPPNFHAYGGGVLLAQGCNDMDTGHLMLLVGSGREDGEEYWLFKNSYGIGWGEGGYLKWNKKSTCYPWSEPEGQLSRGQFSKTFNQNHGDIIESKVRRQVQSDAKELKKGRNIVIRRPPMERLAQENQARKPKRAEKKTKKKT